MIQELFSASVISLFLNSFVESFFLLPPPDIILIAFNLAKPQYALFYALVCTIASVLGGAIGYLIGKYGGKPIFHWLIGMFSKDKEKSEHQFREVEKYYKEYGSWAVFFAAFTPIPYKVFTIASGILDMKFWSFMLASLLGRGGRFFVVSIALMLFGESVKKHLELVIIGLSLIVVVFFVILFIKRHKFIKKW